MPNVTLMDMQREIQWFMRPYLIDFLIEAHAAFSLLRETLFLTINLLDRYCSSRMVYKQHYQLVGCAALLIAAKYGDNKDRVPQINGLNNMCCGLYDAGMSLHQALYYAVQRPFGITVHDPTNDSKRKHVRYFISCVHKVRYFPLSELAFTHLQINL
jgi:hypothetical protein